MQGRNRVEEVLCLSAIRDYAVFYRNREDSNMLSDIVVAHPISIEMLRTWPYVLIMDTTYKTNKYNMPLLEMVGMTPTGKNFTVASAFMRNEQATTIYDAPKNKCGHYLRTSHGLSCACELITRFDHVLPIQLHDIDAFWQTLEISGPYPSARQQDMDSEMRSLTDLLHQISTGPISKVREMRHLAKGVLNPVLPEDPGVTLTSPPEKSSGSVSGSGSLPGSGSGLGSRGRGRPPRAPREKGRGRDLGRSNLSAVKHASSCSTFLYTNAFPAFIYPFISNWENVIGDGNCGYRVVANFVFGDEHLAREERVNELVHRINWLMDGPLGSTTVLPLYSYSDNPEGILVIGFLIEEQHFIQLQLNDMCPIPHLHVQWIHHCSEWVSNWADSYQHRIADWTARIARNKK
ncbi:hypothetical protein M9H77_29885 [Catharanthus roseus]|uniref:Uncharacterized protein n=1 Tax=Catharanthus roseus TaxID=4058 RepID=A0ACB9ZXX0_CATRO|nr:hypothetical protein M9H77_29885 [Catharanthus roseus]